MRKRAGLIGFITFIQVILFLTHFFLYQTWAFSLPENAASSLPWLRLAIGILSVSFLAASLLAFRYTNPAVRAFYRFAAVWLGFLSFLFFAGCASWIVFALAQLARLNVNFHTIVEVLFAAAALSALFALLNASWTRVRRITIRLENLPEVWRGRTAALISDLHLGHVRNGIFMRRIVAKVMSEKPDAVFVAGDLYDGTAIDAAKAA